MRIEWGMVSAMGGNYYRHHENAVVGRCCCYVIVAYDVITSESRILDL